MPCSSYDNASERVRCNRDSILGLLKIRDGLVLHAYPVSYVFQYPIEIMTFALLWSISVVYTFALALAQSSNTLLRVQSVRIINIQFLQVLAFLPHKAHTSKATRRSTMSPTSNNVYYAHATCSGFGRLPGRMRDAKITHAPLPAPFPSSTSLQGLLNRSKSGYRTVRC